MPAPGASFLFLLDVHQERVADELGAGPSPECVSHRGVLHVHAGKPADHGR